ncbi:MAG: Do family serine endopeptidase [Thermonemataceae bacterium]|nr:Do family serine endopeptidase [Thermonemataceae bacterium]
MKEFRNLALAALLGGTVSAGLVKIFDKPSTSRIQTVESNPMVRSAIYTKDAEGNLIPIDFTQISEKVTEAVVFIKSTSVNQSSNREMDMFQYFFEDDGLGGSPFRRQQRPSVGTGSGVIVDAKGYIVTNNHVINNADVVEVSLTDGRTFKAKVVGTDPNTDLAVIKIEATNLPFLKFANSDDVKVGEWVLAVGNPFNLNSTVTAGIVSAKARNININRSNFAIESFIQTDAAINPGNSGGALVNLNGDIIGINTAIASPTGAYSGYGFAVPANIVAKIIDDFLQYGAVQRGFLGVQLQNIDGNIAKEKELELTSGALVAKVNESSAADKAGIKENDVIVEIEGKKIHSVSEVQETVARKRPGDEINVVVNRSGKEKTMKVQLRNEEGNTEKVKANNGNLERLLGAKFEDIDKKEAKKLGISGGVKVKNVGNGKLRRYTNMRDGFIITKVDRKPINNLEDLEKALQNANNGIMLEGVYEDVDGTFFYAFGL